MGTVSEAAARRRRSWRLALILTGLLGTSSSGWAPASTSPRVQARFELDAAGTTPFPADWLTVPDPAQRTGVRIAAPGPRCALGRSACEDLRLLAELDGFDLDPRLALRFTGAIDLGSVTARSIFLIRLVAGPAEITGVDRLVWDPATFTLYARPDTLLEPETRYGVVVTRDLRDSAGRPVEPAPGLAAALRSGDGPGALREHRAALRLLRSALERRGIRADRVATASVFTTGSVSAFLEQARDALDWRPPPAAVMTAPEGGGRAWFPRAQLARLVLRRHVGRLARPPAGTQVPGDPPEGFQDVALPLDALPLDAVRGVGIGWYWSPSYLTPERRILEAPTLAPHRGATVDVPVPFVIVTPTKRAPPEGWPLALFGHGYGGEMLSSALLVGGHLARHGIATAAISVVGHGGGPEGHLLVGLADGRTQTVRVPGRGIDLDADGRIGPTEGLGTLPGGPLATLGTRDGLRQQVVDLMAFARAVRGGLDIDGDGVQDTGLGMIGYAGHSLGGIYGTMFLAVDSRVRVGVLSVPGGPVTEIARLSPAFRPLLRDVLARRNPPLLNLEGAFQEDLPLRGDGPVVAPAAGALAIQEFLAQAEWLGRRADPVAYARHLRQAPLPGLEPARVLVQWALGDRVVPNPTTGALVRAGELTDRTVVVRSDRVVRASGAEWPDPHGFLLSVRAPGLVGKVALAAQEQLARFLRDDGEAIWTPADLSPPGADGTLFESPAVPR
jgi:hypothetical protein